ncbi:MAG: hypothetical protein ABI664_21840 [bacterium]
MLACRQPYEKVPTTPGIAEDFAEEALCVANERMGAREMWTVPKELRERIHPVELMGSQQLHQ